MLFLLLSSARSLLLDCVEVSLGQGRRILTDWRLRLGWRTRAPDLNLGLRQSLLGLYWSILGLFFESLSVSKRVQCVVGA